jgi:regulator of RNase E activity RraA
VTGKWRIQAVESNGDIEIAGIRVSPGDIVVADDTGVCFIPRDRGAEVLARAQKRWQSEQLKCQAIDDGVPIPDLPPA